MQRIYRLIGCVLMISLLGGGLNILPNISAQKDSEALWKAEYDGTLRDAQWSPDGEVILTWADWLDEEKAVRLWDSVTGTELWTHPELINGAQWNATSTLALTWGGVKAEIWARETGEPQLTIEPNSRLLNAAWNADETLIFTHSFNGELNLVQVWSAVDGAEVLHLDFPSLVKSVTWHPNGEQLVTSSGLETFAIQIWNVEDGAELQNIPYTEFVYAVRWNTDASQLIGYTEMATLLAWSAESGELMLTLENNTPLTAFEWNADGTQAFMALTVEGESTVVLWDLVEEIKLFEVDSLLDPVNQIIWSSDGNYWFSISLETARILNVFTPDTSEFLAVTQILPADVLGGAWNGDHSRLLTWTDDSQLQVWDTSDLVVEE